MSNLVANTILQQLGGRRFKMITGAKPVTYSENQLTLKIDPKLTKDKATHIRITLDPSDTYKVETMRVWGTKITPKETMEGVYCDMLEDVFEEMTGLLTRF